MPGWQLSLELGAELPGAGSVFARIARAVTVDIARGRVAPGQRLPGSRSLAASLGVHRNTVVAAFQELAAQGWVTCDPARGTFVAGVADPSYRPGSSRRSTRRAPLEPSFPLRSTGRGLRYSPDRPGTLMLGGGRPDARLFPSTLLARAYRRVLKLHGPEVLDYGDPRGEPSMRAAIATMISQRRGIAASPDDVLVTRGAQMALWLVAHTLIEPGDRVAVEEYGYSPAWAALAAPGAELCPVGVDAHGMRVEEIEPLARRGRLRAVYITPHHQFPTTAVLQASRRLRLLALAKQHGLAIIEDDYDNEYHYEGRPVLPLASGGGARASVVYVGTLSKVLAPGLRIGFVVAPRKMIDLMTDLRMSIDRQGDRATERAIAELLEDGDVQRHVWRMRRIYLARRDALADALRSRLGGAVELDLPS